jgi:hypothetical protein
MAEDDDPMRSVVVETAEERVNARPAPEAIPRGAWRGEANCHAEGLALGSRSSTAPRANASRIVGVVEAHPAQCATLEPSTRFALRVRPECWRVSRGRPQCRNAVNRRELGRGLDRIARGEARNQTQPGKPAANDGCRVVLSDR